MANPNKRGGGDYVQNDPNYFNPSQDNNQAPNFLGYSRGVDAPQAQRVSEGGADRWSQIGNVWRQTVEGTIDTGIKAEINDKIRKGAEDVRDVATNVVLPAELQKGVSEMDRLKRSRDAGTMSDTHYYATLDYMVRKQRQRFPGYGAEIDQAIQDVVGVVPANALRRELASRADAGLSEDDKFWRQYKKDNGQYLFKAFGEQFYADPRFEDPAMRNQIFREVDRIKAHELTTSINKNDIGVKSAAGELTHDLANDGATQQFWGNLTTMVKAGSGTFGASYKELQAATAKAKEDGTIDANEQEQIRVLFGNFRATADAMYNETLDGYNKEFQGSYRQYMSESGKAALQKSYDDWMGNFERQLNSKDFGTLTFIAAMDEANAASNIAKIRKNNEYVATASAIADRRLLGTVGEGIYLQNPDNLSALTNEVMNLHSKQTLTGAAGPIKDAPRKMGADEGLITPSEKGKAVTGSLRKTIDVITNGDASDEAVTNAVESLFGPGNQGFLGTIGPSDSKDPARDKKAAREKILLEMTAPAFLERIKKAAAKTGNAQLMENVARFTEDSAGVLFREEAQNLQSIVTDYAGSGQLYFDSTANQFRIYDYARPGQSKTSFSSQFQNSLDRVNMSLKSLENVYKAQGMKPDEISTNIAAFWSNPGAYGINPSAQPNASDTIFDAVGDFLTSVSSAVKNAGSGEGKTTFKPADSRASRMNLGAQDLSQGAIDDMVFELKTGQEASEVQAGERPFPVPGRREPMQRTKPLPQEDPEGELKVRYPWPGRMDAGLGDLAEAEIKQGSTYDFKNYGSADPGRVDILDKSGNRVATAYVSLDGKGTATIDAITTPKGPNSLGTGEMKKILRDLQKVDPSIKRVEGERVSGARANNWILGGRASVNTERAQSSAPTVVDPAQSEWVKNRAAALDKTGRPVEYFEKLQSKGANYVIIDRQTGQVVGDAKNLRGAINAVDRRDNRYGAYRYSHEKISDLVEGKRATMQERAIGAGGIKSSGVDALNRMFNKDDMPK